MIPETINEILKDDLAALVAGGVPEGRTIEYKRELPGNSDSDKKEFLADASSFANTSGGDLIFGVEEDRGVPTRVVGVQAADLDLEIRRIDSILSSGLSPRIRYAVKTVPVDDGRVLVIRVERSWSGPHRVVFQGHDKFYARNSAGKYPLDVNELRAAFTLSATVTEKIRAFRTDRIIALANNQTPLQFVDAPKVILHCMPLESFAGQPSFDVLPFKQDPIRLQPMGTSRWDVRLNLDGVLAYGTHQPAFTYTQLYRSGIIEVVHGNLLAHKYEDRLVIPSVSFEEKVFSYLPRCFRLLREVGASAPVALALTLTQTKGLTMGLDSFFSDSGYPIDSDSIVFPESLVEDLSIPVGRILKPIFDLLWNACGLEGSLNFDREGNWVNRTR
jgi:hypothetical protein